MLGVLTSAGLGMGVVVCDNYHVQMFKSILVQERCSFDSSCCIFTQSFLVLGNVAKSHTHVKPFFR